VIPVRLQLKNFMSYGEGVPPLEFSGIRIACLSGDNGNGKTALLDAITWALWGETRATSEDDVIRLGAADCRVLLDFIVEAPGTGSTRRAGNAARRSGSCRPGRRTARSAAFPGRTRAKPRRASSGCSRWTTGRS
jgi:exonuclease SbcC